MIVFLLPPRLLGSLSQDPIKRRYSAHSRRTNSLGGRQRDNMNLPTSELFVPMVYGLSADFNQAAGTSVREAPWMKYSPERIDARDSYDTFLDELGFLSSNLDQRTKFVVDLTDHVDYSTFRYARQSENEREFKKMVLAFLDKCGAKYWGPVQRRHLQEPDPYKGYLYPRDALRQDSRYAQFCFFCFSVVSRLSLIQRSFQVD